MKSSKISPAVRRSPVISVLLLFLNLIPSFCSSAPLNCSDTSRVCISFIAYKADPQQNLAEIKSMFDVLEEDVTMEQSLTYDNQRYLFVRKNCSCSSPIKKYLSNTTFTVRKNDGFVFQMVTEAYEGLAFLPNSSRRTQTGAVISLHLLCGCSSGLWNYLMSYVMQEQDTLESLASRFGVSMSSIESVNGIAVPNYLAVGTVYYIPLNSVPGELYSMNKEMTPAPSPSVDELSVSEEHHSAAVLLRWILGSMGFVLFLILAILLICFLCKSPFYCSKIKLEHQKDHDRKISHKFHILRRTSFCYHSGRFFCCKSGKPTTGDTSNKQINFPKDMITAIFDVEKPVVFTYEEIFSSTSGFSDSNLLGHGTYGSVYYSMLRDQEVVIKRMTATKTKEFMAEMKVLCKVHHTNLVEVIGYAASDDELFLIYEYTHKSSLGNHLHDPQSRGLTFLSWIARVQIALDAARGLEYIHEHTKAHYVHRDIKTGNILLDNAFRAKISDFGLAKLVGKTGEGEASSTRVVGTFGYLAPECLSDGQATTKSDVYAFGVVLFELISGKEAITRSEGMVAKTPERRSLASIMLAALRNTQSSMSMESLKECIDPNLRDMYPHDCVYKPLLFTGKSVLLGKGLARPFGVIPIFWLTVRSIARNYGEDNNTLKRSYFQMAMLAKQCVEKDPILRPNMKHVVITLSQILLSSAEWEATLAGNSQVFSDLIQGR